MGKQIVSALRLRFLFCNSLCSVSLRYFLFLCKINGCFIFHTLIVARDKIIASEQKIHWFDSVSPYTCTRQTVFGKQYASNVATEAKLNVKLSRSLRGFFFSLIADERLAKKKHKVKCYVCVWIYWNKMEFSENLIKWIPFFCCMFVATLRWMSTVKAVRFLLCMDFV